MNNLCKFISEGSGGLAASSICIDMRYRHSGHHSCLVRTQPPCNAIYMITVQAWQPSNYLFLEMAHDDLTASGRTFGQYSAASPPSSSRQYSGDGGEEEEDPIAMEGGGEETGPHLGLCRPNRSKWKFLGPTEIEVSLSVILFSQGI